MAVFLPIFLFVTAHLPIRLGGFGNAASGQMFDVQNLPRQLSLKEEEDLIYLNNMICHYYELFQQKWSRRIERMLQERRRQAENVKLSQEAECFVGEISEKLLAADNSTQYSKFFKVEAQYIGFKKAG